MYSLAILDTVSGYASTRRVTPSTAKSLIEGAVYPVRDDENAVTWQEGKLFYCLEEA